MSYTLFSQLLSYNFTGFGAGPGAVIFCSIDSLVSADPDVVSASFVCVTKGGRGSFFTEICSSAIGKISVRSVLELVTGYFAVLFPLDDDLSGADIFQAAFIVHHVKQFF